MFKNKHSQFLTLNPQLVRSSPDLMAFYVQTFEQILGYKPNCVGCSFNSDFQKLKTAILSKQTLKTAQIMENTNQQKPTFVLRQKKGEILVYRKDNYSFRCYDYNLTEEFVINYLTYGTSEEIAKRKKLFSKLPSSLNRFKVKSEDKQPKKKSK